jgi:predicted  nucleic acid-binding Zn-ribbon protein
LQQLKSWLQNEQAWLQSEYGQLQALKAQLDEAARDLAHWNDMIQNQQATIAKTQSDLDYWTSKKNQLTSQLNDAQTKVDQLTTQVRNLESQQTQLQSSLDSDSAKEQQLNSSIESDRSEVSKQQELIASRSSEKSTVETTLQKCEVDIQKAKNQADALNYEINLVVVHPYLEWGGLAILAVAIAALIVTTVGVAALVSGIRAGIGTVRGLPRKLRAKRAPEMGVPAEVAEEAPVEVPAKPSPEIAVIPSVPTAPKMNKAAKRRPSGRRKAAKQTRKPRHRGI